MTRSRPLLRRFRACLAGLCGLWVLAAPGALWSQEAPTYDHPLFTGPAHAAPEPTFDQQHLRLALHLDLDQGSIRGDAMLRLRPLDTSLDTLVLHAAGLSIDSVLVGLPDSTLTPARFRQGRNDSLHIALLTLRNPDAPFAVRLFYRATPQRGITFVRPSSAHPAEKHQAWTQSRPEDVRRWIPLNDTPGDKLTSELEITADTSYQVLSNGRLAGTNVEGGLRTWHYVQDRPHAPHLIFFAAGDYEVLRDRADVPPGRTVLLPYWVYPERIGDAARTFGRTPDMMRFFSSYTGVPYPWEAYGQVVLRRHPTEAQTHTGVATLSDATLLDARAALDGNADVNIARALARQWVGTLVTPRYWNDLWLQEGFATYLAACFAEQADGPDDMALRMMDLAERYFEEAHRYRRPLVWNRWEHPAQLLDAHGADKGAWVLHMLRRRLGDERFRAVLQQYLTSFALKPAETGDFQHTVEAVTGEAYDYFFDQWIRSAGHPELVVRYAYDDDAQALTVTVEQRQEGPGVPQAFALDLDLDVHMLTEMRRFQVPIDAREQTYVLSLAAPPRFVVADPDQDWLAEVTVEQPARAWVAQLRYGPGLIERIRAARALTAFTDDPALAIGLRNALEAEPAAVVRAAIVKTIGRLAPSPALLRGLRQALDDEEAAVRVAVLDALGSYAGDREVHALAFAAAQNDRSYRVQAAAVIALALTDSPDALDVIRSALVTPSHRDVIRRAAFTAMAVLEIPDREALTLVLAYSTPDQPDEVRAAAAGYLALLAPDRRDALNRLIDLLGDEAVAVRQAALRALATLRQPPARAALERRLAVEPDPSLHAELRRLLVPLSTSDD